MTERTVTLGVEVEESALNRILSLLRQRTDGVVRVRKMAQAWWSVRWNTIHVGDDAAALVCDHDLAENFSRALNEMGWMIVPQPEVAAGHETAPVWPMDPKYGPVPSWAEDCSQPKPDPS